MNVFRRKPRKAVQMAVYPSASEEWCLSVTGTETTILHAHTQKGALTVARTFGQAIEFAGGSAELFIHGEDGKVREKETYGHDPRSTRG